MEPFIADLINNPKVPKWLRYLIVTLICGFVIFVGVTLTLNSPMLVGRIFSGVISLLVFAAMIYLYVKIAKSGSRRDNR